MTDVDLTSTTSTGDPEGETREQHEAPAQAELEARLERLRGEVELPIPAASAVKIGGERALPAREERDSRSRCLGAARMSTRSTSSRRTATTSSCGAPRGLPARMCARSPRRSAATARACGEPPSGRSRSKRPTPIGVMPVSDALARLPAEALDRVPYGLRAQVLAFEAETGAATTLPALPPPWRGPE